jgi:NAD-dependent dihydropyrimidine dehydrogenase PreA subunit
MRFVIDWLVAYFCRWFPSSGHTGLFPTGHPDEGSTVLVTANFSLTLKRVKKALKGQNLWLLVANSEGINVWCASGGGIFTHNRVIDAIKVSGLADKVEHREIILPALSAPGMDLKAIKEETGFRARFGPVYARDIPAYLEAGKKKIDAMKRFKFDFKHRLDMFVPMNFPIYLLLAIILVIFWRQHLLGYTIIFWSAVAFLYISLEVIPGKTGWSQAFFSANFCAIIWAGTDWYRYSNPFMHWGWLIALFAIFFAAGFDLAGTASPRRSDAEMLMHHLGFKSFGSLFSKKDLGEINLDRDKCKGCKRCVDICPVGVYGELDIDKKTTFRDRESCFACVACVKQCPEGALSLN